MGGLRARPVPRRDAASRALPVRGAGALTLDAVIVGSGPNGLGAAVTLARAGWAVRVYEAADEIGGGTRTAELTLPGFRHDVCSAFHPLAAGSPFLRALPLERHGLEWVHPEVPFAHALAPGRAVLAERDLQATAVGLDGDGRAYQRLIGPLARAWPEMMRLLGDPFSLPRHPLTVASRGLAALLPARTVGSVFSGQEAPALFAGAAAHAFQPLERPTTAAFGFLLLAAAHAVGWPVARGGSQAIANALAGHLRELGGEIVTGHRVDDLGDLPPSRAVMLDLTPKELLRVAGDRLSAGARRRWQRWRYGPAVYKLDYALDGPMPWKDPALLRAGTVHIGGTAADVTAAERTVGAGQVPGAPFMLVGQQSLFDGTRVPSGQQTLWVYAHVPNGCREDLTNAIEARLDLHAPGFRDRVLARAVRGPGALEAENANYVGGDISGGAQGPVQFLGRMLRPRPYASGAAGVWVCSAATPPGAGVHGLAGYHAARAVLRHPTPPM